MTSPSMSLHHRETPLYSPGLAYFPIGVAGSASTRQDSYIEATMEWIFEKNWTIFLNLRYKKLEEKGSRLVTDD